MYLMTSRSVFSKWCTHIGIHSRSRDSSSFPTRKFSYVCFFSTVVVILLSHPVFCGKSILSVSSVITSVNYKNYNDFIHEEEGHQRSSSWQIFCRAGRHIWNLTVPCCCWHVLQISVNAVFLLDSKNVTFQFLLHIYIYTDFIALYYKPIMLHIKYGVFFFCQEQNGESNQKWKEPLAKIYITCLHSLLALSSVL